MEKLCILCIIIGFFWSASHLVVQSLPIKYNERNSRDKVPPLQRDSPTNFYDSPQEPQKRLEALDDAGQGPTELSGSAGLIMFPKSFKVGNNKLHPIWRKNRLDLFPNNTKNTEPGNQTTGDTTPQAEMTVSMPKFKTDILGNILFEKWVVTHRDLYENTQKQYFRGRSSNSPIPKIRPRGDYEPPYMNTKSVEKVCQYRSTIYNRPTIIKYVNIRVYDRIYPVRAVWMDLREIMHKEGNSMECHTANMTDWKNYTLCAIKRNMRMEYLIPMYPLFQRGYYFHLGNYWT